MRLKSILLAVVVVALPSLARADGVQEALQKFGLFGVWAPDCNKPRSATNVYAHFSMSDAGRGSLSFDAGPGYDPNVYIIHEARLLSSNKVELKEELLADGKFTDAVFAKINGKLHTISAKRADGTVLVQNGRLVPSGRESVWLVRCSD
ncbi:MAG: hypothetical protein QOK29_2384 [Rhodospirillaceae bacterium]|jgi:hypothetical protein|nr:hypothetical protein [Rhodospirillaceae bacterium]